MSDPGPQTPLTDAFLDRIVEGELPPADLRAALDRLERDPDGWKRCTLAFLEAQCWRESFRAIDHRTSADGAGVATPAPAPPRSRPHRTGWQRLSIAAGIAAVSFALGWRSRPVQRASRGSSAPPAIVKVDQPASRDLAATVTPLPPIANRQPDEVATPVAVPPTHVVAVPVVARPTIDDRRVNDRPPPITEHQQALLAQRGYQVDRRHRLVTATLPDGRRVTMPIEQIRLRYQGNEPL